jgi:FAD/FMN-containing dehydrogenase
MENLVAPDTATLDKLKKVLGPYCWKSSDDAARFYEDPRDRFTGQSALIALPDSTEQVVELVKICQAAKVGIVPYSGGTGVVAGQFSPDSDGLIILSLERMNKVREVSLEDEILVAEAGCILSDIHRAAEDVGKIFPLSMASQDSCRIGGNLATNAGGIQVLRYGNARDLCIGIEAVMADGSVLQELNPLRKNNTGYDLRHLLIGSEGTLGVITAASLKLMPKNPETITAFCAVSNPAAAVTLLHTVKGALGDTVSGFELLCDFGMNLLAEHFPDDVVPFEQSYGWYVLIEISGHAGIKDELEETLAAGFESELVLDAVVAQSDAQREALWRLRERTPEANRLTGAICNSDTSVPISQINAFVAKSDAAILAIYDGLRVNSYGHIGDGNIHLNVFSPAGTTKKDFLASHPESREAVRMAINEVTHDCGGTISAEHGIGRLKISDLEMYCLPGKFNAMKSIKAALDPNGIMNPGALFSD